MRTWLAMAMLSVYGLGMTTTARAEPVPSLITLTPQGPTVNLTVSQSALVPPDIAVLSLVVSASDKNRTVALEAGKAKLNKVLAVLKSRGIADKDIESVGISVGEDYDYLAKPMKKRGYAASATIRVTTRSLDSLPELVNDAVEAGANIYAAPDFDVENKQPVLEKLTTEAMDSGRKRAAFHAKLNAFSSAKLLSISDEISVGSTETSNFGLREATYEVSVDPSEPSEQQLLVVPKGISISVKLYLVFEMTR